MRPTIIFLPLALLAGCSTGQDDAGSAEKFTGIDDGEIVTLSGTEPFWNVEIGGDIALFKSPENPDGTSFAVDRFAGLNGLSFSGQLDGASFDAMVTPGDCSDGMSDRTYPYTVTVTWGQEQLNGCGHTDRQPFTGPETP